MLFEPSVSPGTQSRLRRNRTDYSRTSVSEVKETRCAAERGSTLPLINSSPDLMGRSIANLQLKGPLNCCHFPMLKPSQAV